MTDAKKFNDHTDALRDAADRLADRMDHVAAEMGDAKTRLTDKLGRALDAAAEFSVDAERPARNVARAIDDLGYEMRRSFDRITRPPQPRWYERLMFWK
jgi:hypothetical protein